jgi:hypothetical protein
MQHHAILAANAQLSQHAHWRQAQRSFPDELIVLLLNFAREKQAGRGCLRYQFDKKTWAEAAEWLGQRAVLFERYRNKAYLIEGRPDTVVTVAWKH